MNRLCGILCEFLIVASFFIPGALAGTGVWLYTRHQGAGLLTFVLLSLMALMAWGVVYGGTRKERPTVKEGQAT